MNGFSKRACQLIMAIVVGATSGPAQDEPYYTDPVGYIIRPVPGSSEVLIPLQLGKPVSFMEDVTEVTSTGVRFAKPIPTNAFRANIGGTFEVRTGAMAGLGIPATGISGDFVTLERSPVGLVSPGDFASLREQHTLGDLFWRPEEFVFLKGTSAEEADNISIWDAKTQTSRVFYWHTGLGWREAGKFSEGDKSNAVIPFPSGIIVRRRAPTPVDFFNIGSVIFPLHQRFYPVWTGRNFISAPLNNVQSIASYIRPLLDTPHTIVAASSAPRADTLRLNLDDGTVSPVIYFQNDGWRTVGTNEDASDTAVQFTPGIDLQRVGPTGYIRFQGINENFASSQSVSAFRASAAVVEVKPVTLSGSAEEITVTWPSKPGTTYQVQTCPMGSENWRNLNNPVQANGTSASMSFDPADSACIRVIEL